MKWILFLTVLAFALVGCAKVDYSCYWRFRIANQTESNIVVIRSFSSDEIIKPGEELEVSYTMTHCGKNTKPRDSYSEGETMQISNFSNHTVQIKIDGKILSDTLWTRKYWDFVEKESLATYTLPLTDELIQRIGFETE